MCNLFYYEKDKNRKMEIIVFTTLNTDDKILERMWRN